MLKETYTLSNGVKIPKLGLGTWFIKNKDVTEAVTEAIKVGYRHFDTAMAYRNEAGVGKAVRESDVDRSELFVTSKIVAEAKSYKKAKKAIDKSLKKLGLDYVDLMIIHSPQPWLKFRKKNRYFEENKEVWRALEEAYKAGKIKAIGVSNFLQDDLENILEDCEVKPMVNQVLAHISNTPLDLIEFCQKNDIIVEAYSPIAHGEAMKNEVIVEMAKKYNVSVPQLCIRYVIQLGTVAIPKTSNPKHMKSNAELDFVINDDDMMTLKNVDKIESYGKFSMFPVYSGK